MCDNRERPPQDGHVDYSRFDQDSVPPEERPKEHRHEGRPDLDYDDTPVGPAPMEGEGEREHFHH